MKGGRYLLGRKLATGGMAEVFQARVLGAAGFEKDVVVKRVLPLFADDAVFRERFFQEARLAALLSHPHIVQIYELVEQEGDTLLAMEAVHGADLASVLKALRQHKQRMSPAVALYIAACIADALAYAHGKLGVDGKPLNLVHRDVTPSNVLLSFEGVPKLIDFGIAKAASSSARTQTGLVLGKPWYLSPEQCYGESIDGKSDVFALGVVLFQMIAGRVPFGGRSDVSAMEKIANGTRPRLSQLAPDVPAAVEDVVDAALTTERDPRPSARELRSKIERALGAVDPERKARDELAALLARLLRAPSEPVPIDAGSNADPFAPAPTLVLMDSAGTDQTLDDDEIGTVDPPLLDATKQVRKLDVVDLRKPTTLAAIGAGAGLVIVLIAVLAAQSEDKPQKPPPLARSENRVPPPEAPPLDGDALAAPQEPEEPEESEPATGKATKPPKKRAPPKKPSTPSAPNATSPATEVKAEGIGYLTIRSQPWAQVWWGAKSLGITQVSNVEMPAGKHNLFLKNPLSGEQKTVTVELKKGERKSVFVELEKPRKP